MAASLTTSRRSLRPQAHPTNTLLRLQSRTPRWSAVLPFSAPSDWVFVCDACDLSVQPGGFVSSSLFDHTSVLRFLETRFGAEVPNVSAWRRATVGDLTSAFNFRKPDQSIPALPSTLPAIPQVLSECAASLAGTTPYQVPNPQSSPTQEAGTAARPSGPC